MPTAVELGVPSVQDYLEGVLGLSGAAHGDEYQIHCPNPQHYDHDPSCDVNLNTGLWNCFSCASRGDLLRLTMLILDCDEEVARRRLQPGTPEAILAVVQRRLAATTHLTHRRRARAQVALPGPYRLGPLLELINRGFNLETLELWGVRFCREEQLVNKEGRLFTIAASIAIPIRDQHGHLLAWCYRRTDESPAWQPKYVYTPGVEISELWFGLNHHANAQHVTIVEGALDTMWLDQIGIPALGLLGASMGDRKIRWLQRFKSVTLMADHDAGGTSWVFRIGKVLGDRMPLRVVRWPKWIDSDDPQAAHPVDVEILHERAVPWQRFWNDVRSA